MEAAVAAARPRSVARWTILGGLLYVIFFVVGTIMLFSGAPDGDATPAKVIQWYSDSGHRDRINVGWIMITLAVFCLLWFIAALRRAVSMVDGEGILTGVVGIGGGIYAALAFASVALDSGIRTMSDDTYQHRVLPRVDPRRRRRQLGHARDGRRGARRDDHCRLPRLHVGRSSGRAGPGGSASSSASSRSPRSRSSHSSCSCSGS